MEKNEVNKLTDVPHVITDGRSGVIIIKTTLKPTNNGSTTEEQSLKSV